MQKLGQGNHMMSIELKLFRLILVMSNRIF